MHSLLQRELLGLYKHEPHRGKRDKHLDTEPSQQTSREIIRERRLFDWNTYVEADEDDVTVYKRSRDQRISQNNRESAFNAPTELLTTSI